MIKIILLIILMSCELFHKKLSPEETALAYQKARYTNYEDAFKYLWPNSVKKEDYLKFKVSYINFQDIKDKFKFKIIKIENNQDEKIVTIEVTRPDIEEISKRIYLAKIGQNKQTVEQMIKKEISSDQCPLKNIQTKVFVKQKNGQWFVLPKVN